MIRAHREARRTVVIAVVVLMITTVLLGTSPAQADVRESHCGQSWVWMWDAGNQVAGVEWGAESRETVKSPRAPIVYISWTYHLTNVETEWSETFSGSDWTFTHTWHRTDAHAVDTPGVYEVRMDHLRMTLANGLSCTMTPVDSSWVD